MAFEIVTALIFFLIEVELIYNVVLISAIQQSDSVIDIYSFFFLTLTSRPSRGQAAAVWPKARQ